VIKKWVWQLLDHKLLLAQREAGATLPDDSSIAGLKAETIAEMEKAADANGSPHPELPLRSDLPGTSGVALGGPMVVAFNTIHGYFDAEQAARDAGGW
jgi:hypothetical protein